MGLVVLVPLKTRVDAIEISREEFFFKYQYYLHIYTIFYNYNAHKNVINSRKRQQNTSTFFEIRENPGIILRKSADSYIVVGQEKYYGFLPSYEISNLFKIYV